MPDVAFQHTQPSDMNSTIAADHLFGQQVSAASASTHDAERAQKHKHHLQNAISHALLIQQRKDSEEQILEAIEALTDLPEHAPPSDSDRQHFASAVSAFQSGDYEDLIDERVAQARCGYTLCNRQPRSLNMRTWKLSPGAGNFCSSHCQQSSARVKVQLSPVPSWERTMPVHILLPGSASMPESPQAPTRPDANAELAFERGERTTSKKPGTVMSAEVVEKTVSGHALPPEPAVDAIEGYIPKTEAEPVTHNIATKSAASTASTSVVLPKTAAAKDNDEEQQWRDMFEHLQVKAAR